MNFSEWLTLSDDERKADEQNWHVLEPGYWQSLAAEATARFAAEFGDEPAVNRVFKSLYQAGELVIAVQTHSRKKENSGLPESYLGFRVAQFPGRLPDGVLVEPGPPSEVAESEKPPLKKKSMRPRARAATDEIVLSPEGEIDFHCAAAFAAEIARAIKKKPKKLVMDLSQVSYIDSSGLAALIEGMQKASAYGGMLCLSSLQESVRTIFESMRLDQAFRIFSDTEAALSAA